MVHIRDTSVTVGLIGIGIGHIDKGGGDAGFLDYVLIAITDFTIQNGYILTAWLTFTDSGIGKSEMSSSMFWSEQRSRSK